ncbi:MAG: TolC family protein, partial [Paludibacteraceae bacterium]|nr:TolC family protein [Paludibacteraceae bacterium]
MYIVKRLKLIGVTLALCLALASCGIYGKYHPTTSVADDLYGDIALGDTAQQLGNLSWRELFTDAHLQTLIDSALGNNHDLRIAHERVNQAEAALCGAQLAYLPSIGLAPAAGFSPQYGINNGTYDLVASASWEIDIFGRTLNSLRRAKAAKQQVLDYEQAARCGLIAGIANTYYTLLM